MTLAEAPVYKLRLGRPSRLPSMFINFETDPRCCPHPQKHYFLIPTSPNLWHPTPLGRPFRHPLGHPLRHPCLSSTIQPSTFPHPANSAHCHFPRSSPIWLCFGCPSHVRVTSTVRIRTAHNTGIMKKLNAINVHIIHILLYFRHSVGGRVGILSVEYNSPSTTCRNSRVGRTRDDPI